MPMRYIDALALLVNSPAPVLFIDTCVFLDIVRAPVRNTINAESAKYAQALCTRSSKTPTSLWLVTSETVQTEWHENITSVKKEVEQEIQRLELKRKHFISAAQAATGSQYQYGQSEIALKLVSQLEATSQALLNTSLVVSPDDAHLINAMRRVKGYRPPAQRGKAEPKDCEIFELFLGLCKDSRAAGITDHFVFASSNTRDYGVSNGGGIQPELNSINARLVHDLAWAVAAIDGRA